MPATSQKQYFHKPRFTLDDLSLRPHREKERRFMPGAFTPKSITIAVKEQSAVVDVEYTANEIPLSSGTQLKTGVAVVFGKFTRKVLSIHFEYQKLDTLVDSISAAAKIIDTQKAKVPQDSIKKNYQLIAELLLLLQAQVKKDLTKIKKIFREAKTATPTMI